MDVVLFAITVVGKAEAPWMGQLVDEMMASALVLGYEDDHRNSRSGTNALGEKAGLTSYTRKQHLRLVLVLTSAAWR